MGDPMVMIREHRPGLQLPAKVLTELQDAPLQNVTSFGFAKKVNLEVSPRSDEIGSAHRQLVRRRVRPGNLGLLHAAKDSFVGYSGNSVLCDGEKRDRTPALQDAAATNKRRRTSARFWSAPAPAALFLSSIRPTTQGCAQLWADRRFSIALHPGGA